MWSRSGSWESPREKRGNLRSNTRSGQKLVGSALIGRKRRCPPAEEVVWALVIELVAHTTRCKHPLSKADSLSPHLEEFLFTESHWVLKLFKMHYDFSGPLKEFKAGGPVNRTMVSLLSGQGVGMSTVGSGTHPAEAGSSFSGTRQTLEPGPLLPKLPAPFQFLPLCSSPTPGHQHKDNMLRAAGRASTPRMKLE